MNKVIILNPVELDGHQESLSSQKFKSFFDSSANDPKGQRKLWVKPSKSDLEAFKNNEIIAESYFKKQGKRTKAWKNRFYILTADFLTYKQVILMNFLIKSFRTNNQK